MTDKIITAAEMMREALSMLKPVNIARLKAALMRSRFKFSPDGKTFQLKGNERFEDISKK